MEEKKKTGYGCLVITIISIIILVIVGIFVYQKIIKDNGGKINPDATPNLLTRAATNRDIEIEQSLDIALSMNFTLLAKEDISGLEITFDFIDENGKTLATKIKQVGNTTKNASYNISISLAEFVFRLV